MMFKILLFNNIDINPYKHFSLCQNIFTAISLRQTVWTITLSEYILKKFNICYKSLKKSFPYWSLSERNLLRIFSFAMSIPILSCKDVFLSKISLKLAAGTLFRSFFSTFVCMYNKEGDILFKLARKAEILIKLKVLIRDIASLEYFGSIFFSRQNGAIYSNLQWLWYMWITNKMLSIKLSLSMKFIRSFIMILNRTGLKTEPCRTPCFVCA